MESIEKENVEINENVNNVSSFENEEDNFKLDKSDIEFSKADLDDVRTNLSLNTIEKDSVNDQNSAIKKTSIGNFENNETLEEEGLSDLFTDNVSSFKKEEKTMKFNESYNDISTNSEETELNFAKANLSLNTKKEDLLSKHYSSIIGISSSDTTRYTSFEESFVELDLDKNNVSSFENKDGSLKLDETSTEFNKIFKSKWDLDTPKEHLHLNTLKEDTATEQFYKNNSVVNTMQEQNLQSLETPIVDPSLSAPQFSTHNKTFEETNFLVVAIYSFETNVFGDLNFRKGDILNVTKIINESWYEGSCASDNYKTLGIFPKNFVKSLKYEVKNIYDLIFSLEN